MALIENSRLGGFEGTGTLKKHRNSMYVDHININAVWLPSYRNVLSWLLYL